MNTWTIFSNHGHVLFCLARDSEVRLRDVATDVGLTERAVQKIVRDLQTCGMISVSKHGRRNRYRIDSSKSLRHDLEAHCTLGSLIDLIGTRPEAAVALPEPEPEPVVPAPKVPPIGSPVAKKPAKKARENAKARTGRQQGSLF